MSSLNTYNCPNCSAPLENLTGPDGVCEYCHTPYHIEALVDHRKNDLGKDGIRYGISTVPCADALHSRIVDFLTSDIAAPLDVLENSEIISKQEVFLPAYYCKCTSTSDYTCELGEKRMKNIRQSDGSYNRVQETVWNSHHGDVRANVEKIVSGDSKYDKMIDDFCKASGKANDRPYRDLRIVDSESLNVTPNAKIEPFSRPKTDLMEKYIRKDMETALTESVKEQLKGEQTRNITLSKKSMVNDEKFEKMLVGTYLVKFRHSETEYTMYANSDGTKTVIDQEPPKDPNRYSKTSVIEKDLKNAELIRNLFYVGMIACGLGAIFGFKIHFAITIILFVLAAVLFWVQTLWRKKSKELKAQLNVYGDQVKDTKSQFLNTGRKLYNSERLK